MNDSATTLLFRYWGKTHGDDYHPLVYHALDVAAVGYVWWDASPGLRQAFLQAFKVDPSQQRTLCAWIFWFLALHDLGKWDVRFQLKAPETVKRCWPELNFDDVDTSPNVIRRFDHGRGGFGWALEECVDGWGTGEPAADRSDQWRLWIAAVTGHHGDIPQSTLDLMPLEAEDAVIAHDRQARRAFVHAMAELFLSPVGLTLTSPTPEVEVDTQTAAQALLAGFGSVCDWIGSNTEVMPYQAPDFVGSLADYWASRVQIVQERRWLQRLGVIGAAQPYSGVATLLQPQENPRGVQVLVDQMPQAGSLMIIEAPTGSGKTEAALALAWQQLGSGVADALVFAVPTQATANAMLTRIEAFAAQAFTGTAAHLVLAHGKRRFHPGFQALLAAGQRLTPQGRQEASAQCAAWLAQSRKRVFLGQIGVCTVDQVLLSVLPVRHAFVRGLGVAKSVLIIDEVHAYDRYMHGLLAEVLHRQKTTGGSVILLSATLPSEVRNRLLQAWRTTTTDDKAPYPVIWQATTGSVQSQTVPDDQRPPPRTVAISVRQMLEAFPDTALLTDVIHAAEAGARVAVMMNLVADAQRLARDLGQQTSVPVDLFHARYRFVDRQEKEAAVLNHYGRTAHRDQGRILVATQVVEQSLDLDFDQLITQICPVDLLFQRLGRLHRHDRPRPSGFATPHCTVLTVAGEDYGLHQKIYGNARMLWHTQRWLERSIQIDFPAAYRDWIESVYQADDWADEPEAVRRQYALYEGQQLAAAWEAQQMITLPRKTFGDDDATLTAHTRDGEMSLTVLPMQADGRLLAGIRLDDLDEGAQAEAFNLHTVMVPASWRKSVLADCATDEDGRYRLIFMADDTDAWVSHLGRYHLQYTADFGLELRRDEGASP